MQQKRDSRITFISKVDFVKEDPSPFCVEEEVKNIGEETVLYYYNDVKVHLETRDVN